jgi:hypothetical protein
MQAQGPTPLMAIFYRPILHETIRAKTNSPSPVILGNVIGVAYRLSQYRRHEYVISQFLEDRLPAGL